MESYLFHARKSAMGVRRKRHQRMGCSGRQGCFRGKIICLTLKWPTNEGINGLEGQIEMECGQGPMALCYKENTGWIVEQLSLMSGHRKRRAREGRNENT